MADTSTSDATEARELRLIGKLELRFALAQTDEELEKLLGTYLTPLLLKLESPSSAVKEKVIKFCQHLEVRIKPQSIMLPVADLLRQFKQHHGALLQYYDLLYIQQGLDRLTSKERVDLLPILFDGLKDLTDSSETRGSLVFNLILRILPHLQLPSRGDPQDADLRRKFGFSDHPNDAAFASLWLGRLIVYTLQTSRDSPKCPGLSHSECSFLYPAGITFSWDSGARAGQNLAETKIAALKFLASGAFTDHERFLPALFASADSNSRIADIGDDILKRFTPKLEDRELVELLFQIVSGNPNTSALPARPRLQTKLLSILSRSKVATTFVGHILQLIDTGLLSPETPNSNAQGLELSKLRAQIFSFVSWTARTGSSDDLQQISSKAISGMRGFIESQGWPNPASTGQRLTPAQASLRSNAYESIGILAPKSAEIGQDEDLGLLRWLFTSLSSDASTKQIFISIDQALGSIIDAYSRDTNEHLQANLRSFLLHHMTLRADEENPWTGYNVVRSTRFAAVRFANKCLPYWDIQARWIDLLAIGSEPNERNEVIEEGRKGLDPYWFRMLNPRKEGSWLPNASETIESYPRYEPPLFKDLVAFLFQDSQRSGDINIPGTMKGVSGFDVKLLGPAASFSRNILIWEALSSSDVALAPSANWDNELDATISTNEIARSKLKGYLKKTHTEVVFALLEALLRGLLSTTGQAMSRSGEQFIELCSLSPDRVVERLTSQAFNVRQLALTSNDRMARELASHAYGIIASHPSNAVEDTSMKRDLNDTVSLIQSWRIVVGHDINKIHGAILSGAYVVARLAARNHLSIISKDSTRSFIRSISEILLESRDLTLRAAAQTALGQLSIFSVVNLNELSAPDTADLLIERLFQDAKAEQEKPIIALGRFAVAFPSTSDDRFKSVVDVLYKLHEVRRSEVQFAVGEALATATARWSSTSLIAALDVDADRPEGTFDKEFLAETLDKILQDCRNPKPTLKKAAAIWLLCMTQYCGHLQEVQDRLRKFQATFASLLSDRDDVVQETGSRGLSLVYEMGDNDLKDSLVRDLLKVFTNTNSSLGGTVSADTELFEPGTLPTGDGSVTTYKDIMSLASEVGDPSLVYRFMSLASNNAIWSSRAAFGRFGLSNVLSDSSVNGYLAQNPKLYPVLFRYKHDPNPNVQRSMNEIWSALVKDPNTVIDQHFDAIMQDLLKSILGTEWRTRQASCAAIADLVQGREIDKFEKHLHDIWNLAFKVLDDIKETVRAAAMSLCQVLANLLIQSLEVGDSSSRRSEAMLKHVLPFLLSSAGLDSSAKEVQDYSRGTLLKIIKKAPPQNLKSFVPEMLEKLLGSLSSLEPEEINYLHLNADKYGMTGNKIDSYRLTNIRASPMMEAIERCLDGLDEESMKDVVTKLEDSLRSAVGLPSKIGCSRVIVSLSTRQNVLFRPFADRILQLLRKLVLDRNDTVSASYSTTIGYLMRLATDRQVMQTVDFSKSLYFDSEDTNHRSVSGEIIHSMSKLSNDRLTSVAVAILPFVFIAKQDSDKQVKDLFDKTWQDNVGGSRAVALYLPEIVGLVSRYLDSPRWVIKHASASAVAELVTSFEGEISVKDGELMWRVMDQALAGKSWEGKEEVLKAFVRFTRHSRQLWGVSKIEIGTQMKNIALREAKRTNQQYRQHALRTLGEFAQVRDDQDMTTDIFKIVRTIVDDLMAEDEDKMDVDAGPATASTETLLQQILASAVDCLFRSLHPSLMHAAVLTTRLHEIISILEASRTQSSNSYLLALFEGTKLLFDGLDGSFANNFLHEMAENLRQPEPAGGDDDLDKALDNFIKGALIGPNDYTEQIRAKKAEAWLAFAKWHRKCFAGQSAPERSDPTPFSGARQSIQEWLAHERSGPIQQTLRQALDAL